MQAVGQLDDQDADVAAHGHDHFAYGFRLCRRSVLDLVELGHAIDHERDFVTELFTALVHAVVGVFDSVVQQRCRQGHRHHADFGKNRGHRNRVRDVRVATLARLPAVGFFSYSIRLEDNVDVGLGVVLRHR